MDSVNKDVKEAVCEAEKFFSVTLAQENLSPAAEKERSLLADKFRKLKAQLGCQNDLPGGGKAPPRPPKGGVPIPAPVPNEDQGGEELYDDVAAVIPQDDYCEMDQNAEANQDQYQSVKLDTAGENYEVMSVEPTNGGSQGGEAAGEDYMAMEEETQEDYEEPQQDNIGNDDNYEITEQTPAPQNEDSYEVPGADSDYEEAEQSTPSNTAAVEADSMYEGVESGETFNEAESSVDGVNLTTKERSETVNWDHLTKNTRPENIEGVILQGPLNKRRKDGRMYLGSKYQKRYCVVRNHVLYYFKDKKASKQQGHILLPGYKAQFANKKGREFTLTHLEGHRTYQFDTTSKEETEKWMRAIQAACDAPMSERHSAYLDELRNKQPSGDEDSLHYADAEQSNRTDDPAEEMNDDVHEDEDLYEVVGAVQSSVSNQQSQPIQDVDYEISATVVTPKSAPSETSAVEPIEEENYELPEHSPPPIRPPAKSQPKLPEEDTPPAPPPPRSSKPQPPTPPTPPQDDMYEIADSPDDISDLPPPPASLIQEENYEVLGETPPTPPPVRPPKTPLPHPTQSSNDLQTEPAESLPERPPARSAPKQPPAVPKRKDELPQSPTEDQQNEINYANVYQALWNCDASDKDELGFRRGDLIYIYEKPHSDWWIGSLFKPQGYSVGLVPKQYVMEAYELSA